MPRKVAWELVRSSSIDALREVDRAALERGLDARDRALARRLVGTEVRRRGSLRALVRHFATGRPNADLCAHLHLGLVQLFFMDRVPDHAAVHETSRLVAETAAPSKVSYVNGVLRAALRARASGRSGDPRRDLVGRDLHLAEPVFRDPAEHPFLWAEDALSLPAPLAKRWAKRYGREVMESLAEDALGEPPLSVRALAPRAELAAELAALGIEAQPGLHPAILILPAKSIEELRASAAFREGRATVQGETALRAAELLGARAGERVLDLCAAPGGKTAVLAASGARVLALDANAERLERARETLARLGAAERVELAAADGAAHLAPASFDAALVDAPCSNTGVLAQRPGARWRYGPAARAALVRLQARLLEEAAAAVRPGGRLVWSTCALEPEENEQRVKAFLGLHGDWQLAAWHETLPGPARAAGPVDGGYAALLTRRG